MRKITIQKVLDDDDVKLYMKGASILGIMYLTNKLYIFVVTFLEYIFHSHYKMRSRYYKSLKNSTRKQIFQCFIASLEILCTIFHREASK